MWQCPNQLTSLFDILEDNAWWQIREYTCILVILSLTIVWSYWRYSFEPDDIQSGWKDRFKFIYITGHCAFMQFWRSNETKCFLSSLIKIVASWCLTIFLNIENIQFLKMSLPGIHSCDTYTTGLKVEIASKFRWLGN